ncbi:MAG: beta-ketoacyl-ACP synthase II [Spirochaetes bacterium]|nr:beta-ketoacyl-ACP synthase II [Spirochaetota bacterium]
MEKRRIVITGMGPVTPLGMGKEKYLEGLMRCKSAVKLITHLDASKFSSRIAAMVQDFNPEEYMDKLYIKRGDRFLQFGIVASILAIKDSKLMESNIDKERIGVIIGSGIGGLKLFEEQHSIFLQTTKVSPYFIPMLITNMISGVVAIQHGFKGPNYAVSSACATSNHALATAFDFIKHGRADVVVAGGAEAAVTNMGIQGFAIMKAISFRNDAPEKASRPFDRDRDGFVMGEGAGVVVLEELEHAKKRGATIYAEMIGVGMSDDAYNMVAPCGDGDAAALCIQRCLKDASIQPADVDYINAHGTSTPDGDIAESNAIKKAFGEHYKRVMVSSTKSMIGHLLGAAGGVELIATILGMRKGVVFPTINIENQDPEIDLDVVPNELRKADVKIALSNSFGFGGHNCTIAIKKFE